MEHPNDLPSTSHQQQHQHHQLQLAHIKEEQDLDLHFELDQNGTIGLNSHATDDESMAVEALRQLGTSAVYSKEHARIETKIPQDLPLLTCHICELQFRTTADLHNHIAVCKHTLLKCHICAEIFERKIDLNNHLVCHAVERPHSCRVCGTLFVNRADFNLHMQTHGIFSDLMQCNVCGLLFQRASSLSNHMKIHNYKPGRALNANGAEEESVDDPSDGGRIVQQQQHELDSTKNVTVLPNIGSIGGMHNWDLHDELVQTEAFPAEVELTVSQDLSVTLNAKHPMGASEQFEHAATFDAKPNKKPYGCTICSKNFARQKALHAHLRLHQTILASAFQCEKCDKSFSAEKGLISHSVFCAGRIKMEGAAPVVATPADVKPVVRKAATPVKRLVNGKRKPCNESTFKHVCEQCTKRFSTKQKLQRHEWIHRKKIYPCEICASVYQKKEDLDVHRLTNHQASSAYWCNDCGKSFSSRQGLWEHNRLHKTSAYLYTCLECNKKFSSRQGFLIHQRAHNDERPYGCRFCWKAFRDGGTLRKHERIHTGERPHSCPLCGKAFNQKVVLREHVRCLHAANWPKDSHGRYKCSLCTHEIVDRDELCLHIVKHSDHLALLAKEASKRNITQDSKNKMSSKLLKAMEIDEADLVDEPSLIETEVETDLLHMAEAQELTVTECANNSITLESLRNTDGTDFALFGCHICSDKFFNKELLTEHLEGHSM